MKFTLTIESGNAAMQTPDDLAEALRRVADDVQAGRGAGYVKDRNGNSVGTYEAESRADDLDYEGTVFA